MRDETAVWVLATVGGLAVVPTLLLPWTAARVAMGLVVMSCLGYGAYLQGREEGS